MTVTDGLGIRSLVPVIACSVWLAVVANPAQAARTDQIYERYSPAVVQVRILNRSSASKKSIGSGFIIDKAGLVVTNYHVVAELVQHPRKYHAEIVLKDGSSLAAELQNIDVVHDLAILRAPLSDAATLAFAAEPPRQGARLFSLGNPYDLGTSIVEGTYNGLLQDQLYDKIHFTASINPGMSGGPTLDSRGQVVGINVATAGNALSFLIPVKYATDLAAATIAPDYVRPANFTGVIRDQLVSTQETLMTRLLESRFDELTLGGFRLPGRFAPFIRCWGDEQTGTRLPYKIVVHRCSTSDSIYVGESLSSGTIEYDHHWYSARQLNRFQFYALYESQFSGGRIGGGGSRELVTRFECNSDFVDHSGIDMKMVLCLRAYKKMRGLYDAVLIAASLNDNQNGLQSRLEMHGVSFENAHLLARKFVDAIAWTRQSS